MTSTPATPAPASEAVPPAADATPATTPAKPRKARTARLASAAAEGKVRFLLLRSSGRTRHVPYLAPKTDERAAAVALRAEGEDKPLAQVAADHGLSLSTLRRRLLALDLSEDVDAGRLDALWDGKADTVTFTRGGAE
ncbi:MAG: hypothetical protein M3P31_03275 [Actinomycetota bacterium]|nr:hypothetical protein [Actinomycetota bacterium]